MEALQYFAEAVGNALNGVFQAICDFLSLLSTIIPNPDPFPGMIENADTASLVDFGFAAYWLDQVVGIDFMRDALTIFYLMMAAGLTFAVIYWGIKGLR